jgi:hypothetical protein
MMRTMTATAGGQARIFAGSKRGRERTKAEEKHQKDGKRTPHLKTILSQNQGWVSGEQLKISSAVKRLQIPSPEVWFDNQRFPAPPDFVGVSPVICICMVFEAGALAGSAGALSSTGAPDGWGRFHLEGAGTIWITFIMPRSSWPRMWQ